MIIALSIFTVAFLIYIAAFLFLKNLASQHYDFLKRNSNLGYVTVNSCHFKGLPIPKSLLFTNQDGDSEYWLHFYNCQKMFEYPHIDWVVGHPSTNKPYNHDFHIYFESDSLHEQLVYMYHTYYKIMFLFKVQEMSRGNISNWKINAMETTINSVIPKLIKVF